MTMNRTDIDGSMALRTSRPSLSDGCACATSNDNAIEGEAVMFRHLRCNDAVAMRSRDLNCGGQPIETGIDGVAESLPPARFETVR
jgi:hypothetical protein